MQRHLGQGAASQQLAGACLSFTGAGDLCFVFCILGVLWQRKTAQFDGDLRYKEQLGADNIACSVDHGSKAANAASTGFSECFGFVCFGIRGM